MKAAMINQFSPIKRIHISEVPTPEPIANEVQIKVAYAGVNPVDWKICEGWLKNMLPHHFPLIPGWDASGTVTAIGKNVVNLHIGDEVYAYCRKPVVQWGTYAEYVCFNANHVSAKPKTLTFAEAAAIPLVGLTAWQALFEAAKLKKGETVLIHAGAGGVGGMAIQFAHYAGATVYTTASAPNHDYVKQLGADHPIDYHNEDFVEVIRHTHPQGVDVILDCVGYETLEKSFDIVKPRGRLISIVQHVDKEKCEAKQLHGEFVFVRPDGKQLKEIADLFDQRKIVSPEIEEIPFSHLHQAMTKSHEGHTRGKIVLQMI